VSVSDLLVVAAGIAAIAWVNWYFFFAERKAVQAVALDEGVQEVAITVKGGYDPATVRVRHGQPVRLVFDRQETSSCSEEVVVGDFGIRKSLPAFKRTTVEFTPRQAGTYDFSCGMGMLHGKLIVE
jgi:plastocyanin domain-containing protein